MRLGGRDVLRRSARPSEWTIRTHLLSISVVVVALVVGVSVLASTRAQTGRSTGRSRAPSLYARPGRRRPVGLLRGPGARPAGSEPRARHRRPAGSAPRPCARWRPSRPSATPTSSSPTARIVCTSHPDGPSRAGASHAGAPWLAEEDSGVEHGHPGRTTTRSRAPGPWSRPSHARVRTASWRPCWTWRRRRVPRQPDPRPRGLEILVLSPDRSQVVLHRLPGSPATATSRRSAPRWRAPTSRRPSPAEPAASTGSRATTAAPPTRVGASTSSWACPSPPRWRSGGPRRSGSCRWAR
jgi:hypothetical protein